MGILQRLINPLIVYFFSTLQHNYGREMLFYWWNLTLVNLPKLQYIILASGVINWLRSPNIYKAVNLKLDYLNGSYKIKIKCYQNSTYNTNIIFNRVYLLNATVRTVCGKIEYIFGEEMSGAYMQASMELNMFLLTYIIYLSNLAILRGPRQLAGLQLFDSYNILRTSIDILVKRIEQFNQLYIQDPHSATTSYPLLDTDNLTSFTDI